MADTVAVMNHGRIEQKGHPEALYDLPETAFVASFLGQSNVGEGRVVDRDGDLHVVEVAGTRVKVPRARSSSDGDRMLFGVRPEKVQVHEERGPQHGSDVRATVRDVSFTGVATQYLVEVPSGNVWQVYEQNLDVERNTIRPGDQVWLSWKDGHAFGVPLDTESLAQGRAALEEGT